MAFVDSKIERAKLREMRDRLVRLPEVEESFMRNLGQLNKYKNSNIAFNAGMAWFTTGKTLEESEYADNEFFVKGYNKGIKHFGVELASSGSSLEDVKEEYKNNKFFLEGFNLGLEALEKCGFKWFNEKRKLEDSALSKNATFVSGYNRGIKALGYKHALKGKDISNIPDNYKNNAHFLLGFQEGIAYLNEINDSKKRTR